MSGKLKLKTKCNGFEINNLSCGSLPDSNLLTVTLRKKMESKNPPHSTLGEKRPNLITSNMPDEFVQGEWC